MSNDLNDRIQELLEGAESELESLPDDDPELLDDTEHPLREVADDVADLIDETDSESLLEALSLTSLPDGSEAESIPQAIAEGDSEKVATLQALTRLSKLSDGWESGDESAFEEGLEDVRDAIATESTLLDEAESDAEPQDATAADEDGEEREEGDFEESLRSAMDGAFDGFGDELREAKAQLEGLTGDEEKAEASDEEEAKASDESDAEEGDERDDDGFFGDTDSSSGTRHSTVSPSPSKRADMRAVKRHSTMPDRDSRRDMK